MKKIIYYISLFLTIVNLSAIFIALMVSIYAPMFWQFMYDNQRLNESINQVYVDTLSSAFRIGGIVALIICVVLIRPISAFRQKARVTTKYDKYGRFNKESYEKKSIKEQKKLDAQRFADMNRILPATVVKQMEKRGSLDPEGDMESLVGMTDVKEKMEEMAARMKFERENHKKKMNTANHMIMFGPPGTGKTTVARIMTGFLKKYGYIERNELIETSGSFFTNGDAAAKAEALCQLAYGRVLFIDEAYTMADCRGGSEAVAVLLKQMEDARGNFVLIFAGYEDEMRRLLHSNPGFVSRIKEYFFFGNYSVKELGDIFQSMALEEGYAVSSSGMKKFYEIIEDAKNDRNFGNARTCRNILDKSISRHSLNVKRGSVEGKFVLSGDDIVYEKNFFAM